MKNSQIVSKTAKSVIGADSSCTKAGGEKQDAAHVVVPDLRRKINKGESFRFQQRGYATRSELQDWGEAEQEVLQLLNLDKWIESTRY